MIKKLAPLLLLIFLMTACSDNDRNALDRDEQPGTQPIHYETDKEQKEREGIREQTIGEKGGYSQNDQDRMKNVNDERNYSDPFTNEESKRITEELNKHNNIAQVQVASTDNRIIVGVMLRENDSHKRISDEQFADEIESKIRDILPDENRDIIVYTGDAQWGRLKNLDARINGNPDQADHYLRDFLNDNE